MPKRVPLIWPRKVRGQMPKFKTCVTCKQIKPVEAFRKASRMQTGYRNQCKKCNQKRLKDWYTKNPGKSADYCAKYTVGAPFGTYDRLFKKQNGKCAICGSNKPYGRGQRFHIDHCHDTSRIRGLLCHFCNIGIGNLRHDISILEAAIRYLSQRSS